MRICHVTFSFTIGGIENLLIDVMNEQSKKVNVFLIIVNNKYNEKLLNRISTKVRIILINRPQGNRWNFLCIIKLWAILLKINPEIIHCHTHNLIRILIPFKRKCIYTIHQVDIPLNYLKRYKHLFSISKAVRTDLRRRAQLDSILIYNGIDFSQFSKRKDYLINNDLRIVQVGRLLNEEKGQDLLIRSIHILIHKYNIKNIHLDIIGDGPSQKNLENIISRYGLQEFIALIGPKDRSWIYKNLCHYHLLVQPSRSEGFGLTLIEAIAAGLPVIASDIDGPAEVLEDVPSALMAKTENVQDLALKMREVLNCYNNNQIEKRCIDALNKVKNKFSVASTAENYLSYYAKLYIIPKN